MYGLDARKAKRSIESGLLLCTTSRHRCVEGYLFDCDKNIKIASSDNWLREMWTWIGRKLKLFDVESGFYS